MNPYRTYLPGHTGFLYNQDYTSYDSCHDAAACLPGGVYNDGGAYNYIQVGQYKASAGGDNWGIYRASALLFDTSTVGVGKTVKSAGILLHLKSGYTLSKQMSLAAVNDPGVHQPLIDTDYAVINGATTILGQVSIASGAVPEGWVLLELNSDGRSSINVSGTTTFNLRSGELVQPGDDRDNVRARFHIRIQHRDELLLVPGEDLVIRHGEREDARVDARHGERRRLRVGRRGHRQLFVPAGRGL